MNREIFLRNNLLLLFLIAILASTKLYADPQSKSFSHWQFDGNRASATFSIGSREVTRLPAYQFNADLAAVLSEELIRIIALENISPENNAQRCQMAAPQSLRAKAGYLQMQLQFSCDEDISLARLTIASLIEAAPSHVHFAKIQHTNQPPFEKLFTRRQIQQQFSLLEGVALEADSSHGETLLTYIFFGFEHILIGVDHIAFLLTLLLLAQRLRDVVLIVTGFTLGHSITLSLAVLGIASPNEALVEALIGFTIALVAIENISAQGRNTRSIAIAVGLALALLACLSQVANIGPSALSLAGLALFSVCYLQLSDSPARALKLRPLVTTSFGLIHGFGFANVLIEVGLPEQGIVPALFGFNIGVEIGQLVIVALLAGLAYLLKCYCRYSSTQLATELLSASLCGLGIFWFIERAY